MDVSSTPGANLDVMPTSGSPTLRIEPAALRDAATCFQSMAATVTECRSGLAGTAGSCAPALGGSVAEVAMATSRAAGDALGRLSQNYAAISAALGQLAATYPQVDAGALEPRRR